MAKKSNILPEDPRLEQMRSVAAEHGGKWTLLDEEGNMVIPPIYDFISEPNNGICLVSKEGKYGYVRTDGSIIIEPTYEKATRFDNGRASVKVDGKWGIIDNNGKMVVAPQYDDSTYFREGFAVVEQNGKFGYIDMEGNVTIPPTYEKASRFQNGLAQIMLDGKYGFINTKGEVVIAPAFEGVKQSVLSGPWQENFAVVTSDGAMGIIDTAGRWILSPKYAGIKLYFMPAFIQEINEEKIAKFEAVPGGYGLISNKRNIIAQPIFKDLKQFSDGLAAAQDSNDKWGYINLNGEWVIAPQYDSVSDFKGDLTKVAIKNRAYVINREGKEVGDSFKRLRSVYSVTEDIIPDRYIIERNGKWGLFDGKLKEILPAEFDDMERWGDTQLVKIYKDDKYGLTDRDGNEILPVKYDSIDIVREEDPLASVTEIWYEKYGAINAEGKWIIPPVYSSCHVSGKAGVVEVKKDNLSGLLDLDGNEILPCSLEYIYYFDGDMATAKKDGKYGILSNKGEWVINPEFDGIDIPSEGLAPARKDRKWGFVNQDGEWVIDPVWDRTIDDFKNGVATVMDDSNKIVIIDRTGKALTKPASTVNVYELKDGMRRILVGRKFGYLTEDAKIAIKPTFDDAEDFSQGWAQVSLKVDKQPVWTFINREGRYGQIYKEEVPGWGYPITMTENEKIAVLRRDGTMATPFIFSRVDKTVEGFIPAKIAGF